MAVSSSTWIIIGVIVGIALLAMTFGYIRYRHRQRQKGLGGFGKYYIGGNCGFPHELVAAPFTGGSEGTYFGGGGDLESVFYGGASTANLVLLKKNGGSGYKVAIGQLKEHGNRLQLPSGFVETDEDMEHAALRGASAMTGQDLLSTYYGKGEAKTTLYKDTPETKRGNVVIVINKEEKYNKHDQNDELDASFSKDSTRVQWVPTKELIDNNTIKSATGDCITVPFYLKRTIKETVKNLK